MVLFNEGDTVKLLLDYTINGSPMVEGDYDEIEFQINPQCSTNAIKKLLSKNEIVWGTATYVEDNVTHEFTGYMCDLDQEDTFKIRDGVADCQLRVLIDGEVGSSEISALDLGNALSHKVLS